MSGRLRAAALHYYETVDAGVAEDVVALFASDAVYRRPGYAPMLGTDALRTFYGGERVIAEGRHTIRNVIVHGDWVAVEGRFAGVLRSGEHRELGFADFFRFVDEMIAERNTYFDVPAV